MGLTWALTLIATALLVARTHVSYRQSERPGWDVCWAVITYVSCASLEEEVLDERLRFCQFTCLVSQVMQTIAVAYGTGNHTWLLRPNDRTVGMKYNWIGRMLGIFVATFGKNVIVALLLRIQGNTHRRKALFLHFVWISNALLAILVVVVLCLRCKPIELWWDKSLDGTCNAIDSGVTQVLGTFQGSWMAASDAALAVYPMFIFWNLQMSWQRKAGLCALMGGGLIAGVWCPQDCPSPDSVQLDRHKLQRLSSPGDDLSRELVNPHSGHHPTTQIPGRESHTEDQSEYHKNYGVAVWTQQSEQQPRRRTTDRSRANLRDQ